MRYLQATGCQIIEKGRSHVKVKLSPQADRELTNRPYYWNFIARTGAEAETMTFNFIFDPAARREELEEEERRRQQERNDHQEQSRAKTQQERNDPDEQNRTTTGGRISAGGTPIDGESILQRYLGIAPGTPAGPGRVPSDMLTFGSRRLSQIFGAVQARGKFINLYEEPAEPPLPGTPSTALYSWLCVQFRVDFVCDMLRSEMHSLAISLTTGEIAENFYEQMRDLALTPRLPPRFHIKEMISLKRAAAELENYLVHIVSDYDYAWAEAAQERMEEEMMRIEVYYKGMLENADGEMRPQIEEQYAARRLEVEWQYRPRIETNVTGCGFFHLANDSFRGIKRKPETRLQK